MRGLMLAAGAFWFLGVYGLARFFAMCELAKVLERPPRREMLERLRFRPVRRLKTRPAEALRTERDAR